MNMQPGRTHKQINNTNAQIVRQLLVLPVVFLPLILAAAFRLLLPKGGLLNTLSLVLALIALPWIAFWLFASYTILPYFMARSLRPKIIRKVRAIYNVDASDAPMVGFAPGSELQVAFGGDTSSDFGLLMMKPGSMTYYGDTLMFGLNPQQVESVTFKEQSSFGTKVPRVVVGWRQSPDQPLQGFGLEAWDSANLWQCRRAAHLLLQQIERWRAGAGSTGT